MIQCRQTWNVKIQQEFDTVEEDSNMYYDKKKVQNVICTTFTRMTSHHE